MSAILVAVIGLDAILVALEVLKIAFSVAVEAFLSIVGVASGGAVVSIDRLDLADVSSWIWRHFR